VNVHKKCNVHNVVKILSGVNVDRGSDSALERDLADALAQLLSSASWRTDDERREVAETGIVHATRFAKRTIYIRGWVATMN